jgi:hypothetical protein
MSIATLKAKAKLMTSSHCGVSSCQKQFSINGVHRSQGYVGQTNLSRSLPRTLSRGGAMRGHGGCCGAYPRTSIVSAVTSTEDAKTVKKSTLSETGMIATKYRWILRPKPYTNVKPQAQNAVNVNSQQSYIDHLKTKTIQCIEQKDNTKILRNCPCKILGIVFQKKEKQNTVTKPLPNVAISQSQYVLNLDTKCAKLWQIDTDFMSTSNPSSGLPTINNNCKLASNHLVKPTTLCSNIVSKSGRLICNGSTLP